MNAQIFVKFEERMKKVINFSTEGYVIPVYVYYGFTNAKEPDNDTVWYDLTGNAGSEICKDLYKTIIKLEPPVYFYDGFKALVNPYLDFKKIIYRVKYAYKFRDSNQHDINNCKDGLDVYWYPSPSRDFWDAVTYY